MKNELIIHYRDSDGRHSERRISDLKLEDARAFEAYCHLRNARRTFIFERIVLAADAETGEIISDLRREFFHLPEYEHTTVDTFHHVDVWPCLPRRADNFDKTQRSKEKYELKARYKLRAIYELYRNRLFDEFDQRCFKCEAEHPLDMDHHVPMILGGKLIPGNIVVLYKRCNVLKRDQPPEVFYSVNELTRLQPILRRQHTVLKFEFDWKAWDANRKTYLVGLGLDPYLVEEMLTNPDHPEFVGKAADSYSVEIKLSIDTDEEDDG